MHTLVKITACTLCLGAAALTLPVPAVLAAGSHGGGHGGPASHAHSAAIGEPGKAAEASRTVAIEMAENRFTPERIEVKKGETVRFVVRNAGELVHEFNIGTAAMHAAHQKEMQLMVDHGVIESDRINRERMKMDMGGGKTMEHNDPNSILVEPGKTGEIVWKFSRDGEFEFACNVPGHYDAGMVGRFHFK